ncbi:hypothetical protein PPROV_000119600 [Pycnococcus provasolii]|uniref:Uncharacterized protein n=1 Tax=Pycnococcus provasolii TaxID=41880 RepID=A0A830HAI9_9CHLO|nr:hypothetical protein PPROV_000119600 [Pycnococcus provasolii]
MLPVRSSLHTRGGGGGGGGGFGFGLRTCSHVRASARRQSSVLGRVRVQSSLQSSLHAQQRDYGDGASSFVSTIQRMQRRTLITTIMLGISAQVPLSARADEEVVVPAAEEVAVTDEPAPVPEPEPTPPPEPEIKESARLQKARKIADSDADTALIRKLKAASDEKREERKEERLQQYYKKNYGDYFGVIKKYCDSPFQKCSENDKAINKWLEQNE